MEKLIGKVKEVFIPKEYKNNILIDKMDSNKIGFKVEIDENIIEIIEEQDYNNSSIYKDDLVVITKQTINNIEFIDIEKYGEYDEQFI